MKKDKKPVRVRRTLYYFWQALMQYKARTIMVLLLVPTWIFISNIVVPWGTSQIVGKLSTGDFEINNYISILLLTLISAGINNLFVIRAIDWLDWSLDAKGGQYLSKLAFDAVINQSMTFHNNKFSGSLTSAANKLPSAFIRFKSSFVWNIYPLILSIIFSIGTASFVCLPFAIILLSYVILYLTVAIVTYYKTTKYDVKLANAENKQTGQLADSITNELSVKSYARENFEARRFSRATRRTHDATIDVAKISFWRNLSMNSVNMVTFAALIVFMVMSHEWFGLSIANIVFLYSLSNNLLSNTWTINHILRNINRAFGDAKEMILRAMCGFDIYLGWKVTFGIHLIIHIQRCILRIAKVILRIGIEYATAECLLIADMRSIRGPNLLTLLTMDNSRSGILAEW